MISASACQTGGDQLRNGRFRIYVDKSAQKDILFGHPSFTGLHFFRNGVYYRIENRMPKLEIRNLKLDKSSTFFCLAQFHISLPKYKINKPGLSPAHKRDLWITLRRFF